MFILDFCSVRLIFYANKTKNVCGLKKNLESSSEFESFISEFFTAELCHFSQSSDQSPYPMLYRLSPKKCGTYTVSAMLDLRDDK